MREAREFAARDNAYRMIAPRRLREQREFGEFSQPNRIRAAQREFGKIASFTLGFVI